MKQKNVHLNKKYILLDHWRHLLDQPLTDTHVGLAGDWEFCAVGERSRKEGKILTSEKELNLESKILGCDFYVSIRKGKVQRAFEIIEQIENIPTIWKHRN